MNNNSANNSKALRWRIAIYVLIALFCSWLVGNHYGDKGLIVGMAVGIAVILAAFAFAAFIIRHHSQWIRQHLGLLVGIFVVLQCLWILYNLFENHK